MAKFKGSVYESTRAFVEREFGADAVEQILAKLPAPERELLLSTTAIEWIPIEPVLHFHHELERTFGNGDLSLCVRAGQFSAGWSMSSVLKMVIRMGSPRWLLEKGGRVWNRYHDSGRWEFDSEAPRRLSGRLIGFEVQDRHFCARLRGWLQAAVELTGCRDVISVESSCRCNGSPHCSYSVSWRS